ncbi:MAG: hypothetical protein LBJ45_00140 [Holosporaceae bacterium]|nr:hypothetical protein [Holosporaceae bacterium]
MKKNLVKCFFMAAGILSLSGAEGMMTQAQIVDELERNLQACDKLAVEGPGSRYRVACEDALVSSLYKSMTMDAHGNVDKSVSDKINSTLAIKGGNSEYASVLNYVAYGYLVQEKPLADYLYWYDCSSLNPASVAQVRAQMSFQLDKVASLGADKNLSDDEMSAAVDVANYVFENVLFRFDITDKNDGLSIEEMLRNWFARFYLELGERSRNYIDWVYEGLSAKVFDSGDNSVAAKNDRAYAKVEKSFYNFRTAGKR